MRKHAYLIIAHKCDYTFKVLLELLDDFRNDIYIHMDKKNHFFDETDVKLKKSKVYFLKRKSVTWGGYSQVDTELRLLKLALKNGSYKYLHLLSGEDLPIKSQDTIHEYFDKVSGKEFIHFDNPIFKDYYRVNRYYWFQEIIGRNNTNGFVAKINEICLKLQDKLKVNRNAEIDFQKGSNWFSITGEFASYIVDSEKTIKRIFHSTMMSDELFIQTVIINSVFRDSLGTGEFDNDYSKIKRLIDWKRGNPYIYRSEDYEEILQSECFFARKFDALVDREIIQKIKENILGKDRM